MPASAAMTARAMPDPVGQRADRRRRDDLGPDRGGEHEGDLLRSRPCPASHTGQNGSCTPITRNAAALNAASRAAGRP